jgi:hypothetical protein
MQKRILVLLTVEEEVPVLTEHNWDVFLVTHSGVSDEKIKMNQKVIKFLLPCWIYVYKFGQIIMLTRKIFTKASIGTRKYYQKLRSDYSSLHYWLLFWRNHVGWQSQVCLLCPANLNNKKRTIKGVMYKKQRFKQRVKQQEVAVIKVAKTLYISFRTDFHIPN